ncbi:YT521-B-like domain containing protein [Naviculisporaceae sp. PSN 640]
MSSDSRKNPGVPPKTAIALDARAAELKEKLSKRKAAANKNSPAQFVPHPLPQVPKQTTIDASANDIAALITSISSNMANDSGKPGALNLNSQGYHSAPNTARPSGMDAQSVQDSGPSLSTATHGVASERATRPGTDQRAGQPTNASDSTNQARDPYSRMVNSGGNGKPDKANGEKSQDRWSKETERTGGHQDDRGSKETEQRRGEKGLGFVGRPQEMTTEGIMSLGRSVDDNPDLKDWLDLTNWHDVEARNRKLSRYRRAKALAAERERIEEEERKLREEEAIEMGFRPPISAPPKNSATETTAEQTEVTPTIPAKRFLSPDRESTERAETRPEKMARREVSSTQPTDTTKTDKKYEDERRGRDTRRDDQEEPRLLPPMRDGSPRRSYRAPSPRREYSPKRSAYPEAPRGPREDPSNKSRNEYDSYKGDGVRREYQRESTPHRGGGPSTAAVRPLDLGREGETRFFIIKSFNEDNVRKCMVDGVWATQSRNGHTLTRAFASCKNVILFFSINKSRAFQGYARMSTPPSPDTPRPGWMNNVHWDSSPPFRVEWMSKVPVPFSLIGGLKNSYNENHPVLVGKDGQEVEERCGRELLRAMQDMAAKASAERNFDTPRKGPPPQDYQSGGGSSAVSPGHQKTPFYPSPSRGKRGGYRGGYRGGSGYRGGFRRGDTPPRGGIKDEDLSR